MGGQDKPKSGEWAVCVAACQPQASYIDSYSSRGVGWGGNLDLKYKLIVIFFMFMKIESGKPIYTQHEEHSLIFHLIN